MWDFRLKLQHETRYGRDIWKGVYWRNERVNIRMNERINVWMTNEWMKEWKRFIDWLIYILFPWMSIWINKWIKKWIKKWMNEWMNKRMNVKIQSRPRPVWSEKPLVNDSNYKKKKKGVSWEITTKHLFIKLFSTDAGNTSSNSCLKS